MGSTVVAEGGEVEVLLYSPLSTTLCALLERKGVVETREFGGTLYNCWQIGPAVAILETRDVHPLSYGRETDKVRDIHRYS